MLTPKLHTWHPNTFGLLYGRTTKTACDRRMVTSTLVKPLSATCLECQDAVLTDLLEQQAVYNRAVEVARAMGYASPKTWFAAQRKIREG